jgi:hypothetical protein
MLNLSSGREPGNLLNSIMIHERLQIGNDRKTNLNTAESQPCP